MRSPLATSRIPGFASLFWFSSPSFPLPSTGYCQAKGAFSKGSCKAAGNLWKLVIIRELLLSTLKLVSQASPRSLCAG